MATTSGHTQAICAKKVIGTTVNDRSGRKIGQVEDVVLDTAAGTLRQTRPATFTRDASGVRQRVECRYVLQGADRFGFAVMPRTAARMFDPRSMVVGSDDDPFSSVAATERLAATDLRGQLVSCWDKHQAGGALTARFPLKVTYKPSEFDDEPGVYKLVMDPVTEAASACIQAVAAPALAATKGVKDKLETTLVVTIK